jgi:2-alkenal reductase
MVVHFGFQRLVVIAGLALAALWLAEPMITRLIFRADVPRQVEARGSLADAETTAVSIFERIAPSVVQVVASRGGTGGPIDDMGEGGNASGTGFIWDNAGHVVTNHHVIDNAASVSVRLASGEVVPASVLGQAPNYDLAVLRLGRNVTLPPPIPLGTSADLKVGQAAFAIGNPFGLDQSLTSGIISALKRRLPTAGGREIAGVIQTDAAINPGNSGGPLLDSAGRLIGVNTAIYSPSGASAGIGFAIPVDVVNRIVPDLIRDGRVPTPGIGILTLSEATTTRMQVDGVAVGQVVQGSPADRAGLRGVDPGRRAIGDVIVAVNGKPVRRLSDLTDELERVGAGQTVQLTILRAGRRMELTVSVTDVAAR